MFEIPSSFSSFSWDFQHISWMNLSLFYLWCWPTVWIVKTLFDNGLWTSWTLNTIIKREVCWWWMFQLMGKAPGVISTILSKKIIGLGSLGFVRRGRYIAKPLMLISILIHWARETWKETTIRTMSILRYIFPIKNKSYSLLTLLFPL